MHTPITVTAATMRSVAALRRFEIRLKDCTGWLLATVEADTVETAAAFAGAHRDVLRANGLRSSCGTNRETGEPGKSGVFTLRRKGANKGTIWIG